MTPFSPFNTADGELNWDAAREQIAVQSTLYWADQEAFDRICALSDDPCETLLWFIRRAGETGDERMIPSFVLWKHRGQYWVAVAGTETGYQWLSNAFGGGTNVPFMGTKIRTNSYFLWAAEQILEKVQPLLPPDREGLVLNVGGHSLGGAVSFLMSCLLKKEYPSATVNNMTFGEPPTLTASFPEELQPHTKWRLLNDLDFISNLPPTDWPFDGILHHLKDSKFTFWTPWDHYGNRVQFDEWGIINGTLSKRDLRPNTTWDLMDTGRHFTPAYVRSMAEVYRHYGGSEESAAALSIVAVMQGGESRKTFLQLPDPARFLDAAEANRQLRATPQTPITPENWGESELSVITRAAGVAHARPSSTFSAPSEGGNMATWKVTWKINQGPAGWSESHYLLNAPNDVAAGTARITEMLKLRVALLGAGCVLVNLRASIVGTGRVDIGRTKGDDFKVSLDPLRVAGDPYNCVTVLLEDVSCMHNRTLTIRGYPKAWQQERWENEEPFNLGKGQAELDAYVNFLCDNNDTGPAWGMKIRKKPTDAAPLINVQAIGVDPTTLQYMIGVKTATFEIGQKLQLRNIYGPGTQGINGIVRVLGKDSTGTMLRINRRKFDRCPLEPENFGTYQVPGTDFVAYRFKSNRQYSYHYTGSAFFHSRSRRKNKQS